MKSGASEHPNNEDELYLDAGMMEEEWDFQQELNKDYGEIDPENTYVKMLQTKSKLILLQKAPAKRALEGPHEELGLFYLFFTLSFWETIRLWTNKRLVGNGLPECTRDGFAAYIGLEMGMSLVRSLVRFNGIKSIGQKVFLLGLTRIQIPCLGPCSSKFVPIFASIIQPTGTTKDKRMIRYDTHVPLWNTLSRILLPLPFQLVLLR